MKSQLSVQFPFAPSLCGCFKAICLDIILGNVGQRGNDGAKCPGRGDECDTWKSDCGQGVLHDDSKA